LVRTLTSGVSQTDSSFGPGEQ